jgi:extracellular elastinolytic metalloproteinase
MPAYDDRAGGTPAARRALAREAALSSSRSATEALRRSLGSEGVVEIDGLTGTPRQVVRLDGFLTSRSAAPAPRVAMDYVRAHAAAFGLSSADFSTFHLRRDYVDIAGTHHLSWVQRAGGIPLFGNGLQANVTGNGRLLSVLGSPVSELRAVAAGGRVTNGKAAIREARGDLGERRLAAGSADRARAVLFQTPSGTRRGWETITMSAQHPALHVIGGSGRVLFRQSLDSDVAKDPADGLAFDYFPGAAAGGLPHAVDYTAKGWLPATATTLNGNNSHTYADVNDDNTVNRSEEIAPRTGNSWSYQLTPFHLPDVSFCDNPWPCSWNPDVPFSWQTNRNQNAAQVFDFVNTWHDHLAAAPIGFTEAAGNFQAKNSTRSGLGGDAVQTETDDGATMNNGLPDADHVDNANMSTPPDGQAPRMQMYLQHEPGTTYPDGDPFSPTNVGDEADTVYHEYTHGLSNRLVVDALGRSTLGDL